VAQFWESGFWESGFWESGFWEESTATSPSAKSYVHDATTTQTGSGDETVSHSHGDLTDGMVVVQVIQNTFNGHPADVKWGGAAGTSMSLAVQNDISVGFEKRAGNSVWYLPLGTISSATVDVFVDNGGGLMVASVVVTTYSFIAQSTPLSSTASADVVGTDASVSVTSGENDLVVGSAAIEGGVGVTLEADPEQEPRADNIGSSILGFVSDENGSDTSTDHGYTLSASDGYSVVAASFVTTARTGLTEMWARFLAALRGTFSRASVARVFDGDRYVEVRDDEPRTYHSVKANDGNDYRTLLLEDAQENLLLQSANFDSSGSPWDFPELFSAITAVTSVFPGETAYEHENNDGGGSNAFPRSQNLAMSSGKSVFAVIHENVDTDRVTWGIRDAGAGDQWVLRYRYLYATDTLTKEFDAVGTDHGAYRFLLGTGPNGGDMVLVALVYEPDNPANTGRYQVFPARAGDRGIPHWAGVFEDPVAASPIVTGASSVTRSADDFSDDYTPAPQEMTVYVEMVDLGTAEQSGGATAVHIGASVFDTDPRLRIDAVSGEIRILHDNGTSVAQSRPNSQPSIGDRVEFRGVLHSDGSVTGAATLNGGAENVAAQSGAVSLQGSWADTRIGLGQAGDGVNVGYAAFAKVVILAGTKTRAECRAAEAGDADVLYFYDPAGSGVVEALAEVSATMAPEAEVLAEGSAQYLPEAEVLAGLGADLTPSAEVLAELSRAMSPEVEVLQGFLTSFGALSMTGLFTVPAGKVRPLFARVGGDTRNIEATVGGDTRPLFAEVEEDTRNV